MESERKVHFKCGRTYLGGASEAQKRYRKNNKSKLGKYQSKYYHKNKKYINAQMAVRRYNKKIDAGEELTEKQKLLFEMHKKYLEENPKNKV